MTKSVGKHIKVVLFDHDDTLVGTIESKWAQHKHIARTFYGKELSDEEIKQHWGKPFSALLGLLYGTDDIDTAMKHNKATHKDYPKTLRDDTLATLEALRASGRKTGIITATADFSLHHDLKSLGIPERLFDYIQTEEKTAYHKPDHRVFEPALNWLEKNAVKPAETLYVGDGLHDMKAALGAGFEFIGITTGLTTSEEFAASDSRVIARLRELVAD